MERIDHDPGIRVYGMTLGQGSLAQVTAGISSALEELGLLAGLVPVDNFDDQGEYGGATARTGVFVGPLHLVNILAQGYHEKSYALVSPNSTWLPKNLLDHVGARTRPFSPSAWGRGIVESYLGPGSCSLWRHGLDPDFVPRPHTLDQADKAFASGEFDVLHLTSSEGERKGTRELLAAWPGVLARLRDVDPKARPKLTVSCQSEGQRSELARFVEALGCGGTVAVKPRANGSPAIMAMLYPHYHLVCQPSRGEAFGLVPLEARACGVPVVMTSSTGHAEHGYSHGSAGVTVCPQDAGLVAIDDGPGALAQPLLPKDVETAIFTSYKMWRSLRRELVESGPDLRARWSWKRVTEQWLEKEKEHGHQ